MLDLLLVEDGAAPQRRLAEPRYDVVVTDVCMPHVNSLSLLHLVWQGVRGATPSWTSITAPSTP